MVKENWDIEVSCIQRYFFFVYSDGFLIHLQKQYSVLEKQSEQSFYFLERKKTSEKSCWNEEYPIVFANKENQRWYFVNIYIYYG